MAQLSIAGKTIPLDQQGYLEKLSDWQPNVAEQIAHNEGIDLSESHWELINLVRQFYETYDHSPAMRILVKYVKQNLGEDKGNSIYLMQLFPGSPAKRLAKIAGLPRPTNCL